jgi:hypothetical protein
MKQKIILWLRMIFDAQVKKGAKWLSIIALSILYLKTHVATPQSLPTDSTFRMQF